MRLATKIKAESGLSLIITLVIAAGASVLIGGVLYYTSTQATLTRRINQYDNSVEAAVAATEKVVSSMSRDFQAGGVATVGNNVSGYTGLIPRTEDLRSTLNGTLTAVLDLSNSGPGNNNNVVSTVDKEAVTAPWSRFEFKDALGQVNRTQVEQVSDWTFREVDAKYPGLRGYATTYRIISNTRERDRIAQIVSAVRQDVQIASIPLCQFQYFFVPDMELHPSAPGMQFNGRIHCNGNLYTQPSVDITFHNHVTTSRKVVHSKHPGDPVVRGAGRVSYRADRETGLNTLNIPIGTNAGPNELRQLLEAPAGAENPASLLAQERLYNKADLIVVVSNDVVIGRSGSYNGGSVSIPWLQSRGIVTRATSVFYDMREVREIAVTDVDIAKLLANYSDFTKLLGRPLKTLWVLDVGDDSKGKKDKGDDGNNGKGNDDKEFWKEVPLIGGLLPGGTAPSGSVRLLNGATLPATGLSVATPNPLYVQGNYNLGGVPALLAGDAVTVLSANWNDANSMKMLSSRVAVDTTVNAAVITGIVPTGGGEYSGGVENSLRLLEDWRGKKLTFNGSVAVLFYSKVADAPWGGQDVFAPPTRAWSYDVKLADAAKTPPSMPAARTVFRSDWTLIRPNSRL